MPRVTIEWRVRRLPDLEVGVERGAWSVERRERSLLSAPWQRESRTRQSIRTRTGVSGSRKPTFPEKCIASWPQLKWNKSRPVGPTLNPTPRWTLAVVTGSRLIEGAVRPMASMSAPMSTNQLPLSMIFAHRSSVRPGFLLIHLRRHIAASRGRSTVLPGVDA